MISVIIPFKNDFELIDSVVSHIIDTRENDDIEIIVVNDGSVHGSNKPRTLELSLPFTRVINYSQSFGVGAAFDRGTESSKGEYLILMGADVFPHKGWHAKVLDAVKSYPTTIGCAVCVGDKPLKDKEGNPIYRNGELVYAKHYGADLLIKMSNDDLPTHSKLRERKGGYTDLFRGRWAEKQENGAPYEISCLMGAYYFTSKAWYQHIGGFDTEYKKRYCGHYLYGHLEPHLSVKSYLCGGNLMLFPDIENIHVFNRMVKGHSGAKGVRSDDHILWNAQWILETMVLSGARRSMLQDFMNFELNLGVARQMIKKNMPTIEKYRDINKSRFKHGIEIFQDKFGCRL